MPRTIGVIGVPSSAGAHWPGKEKAPRALREAGLVERLESVGLVVGSPATYSPASASPASRTRNLSSGVLQLWRVCNFFSRD